MNRFKDVLMFITLLLVAPFVLAILTVCHGLGYVAGAVWGVTKECRDEFADQFRVGYYHMRGDR